MLTQAQRDAIRMHVALDEPIRRLISLATTDLYCGPLYVEVDEDDTDTWPGFVAACRIIRDAMPSSDLYLDLDVDEVIGETEPEWLAGDDEDQDDDVPRYRPDCVLHVDNRVVVRTLVGAELSRYV